VNVQNFATLGLAQQPGCRDRPFRARWHGSAIVRSRNQRSNVSKDDLAKTSRFHLLQAD
jgi:hypothetical protein